MKGRGFIPLGPIAGNGGGPIPDPIPSNTNGENGSLVVTIPEGLSDGTQTTTANDTNLVASNIKKDVTLFGVLGTNEPETNLSLSITGADSFVEGANTQYTASLVLSGVIGSPNTVLTVTLPAGIDYVSSSDSGSEDDGVITWTLSNLLANKSVTFVVTSSTPDEYELTGQVTSDFGNLGTASASKEIEVEAAPAGIELRVTNPDWIPFFFTNVTNMTVTSLTVGGVDKMSDFSLVWSVVTPGFSNAVIKVGTISVSVDSGDLFIYGTIQYDGEFTYNRSNEFTGPFTYTKADPSVITVSQLY